MRTHHRTGRIRALMMSGLVTIGLIAAAPVGAASPPTTLYVSLGDSLAWGDGASVPSETGYTALLADYFAGTPHGAAKAWTNLAVRGETTSTFLNGGQLASAFAAIGDPSTDTRLVTVSLGGNDVGALLNDPSDPCVQDPFSLTCQAAVVGALQTAGQNYPFVLGSIAAAVAAEDSDPEQVYVMTVHNPFGGLGGPFETPVDGVLLGADGQIDCTNSSGFGLNDIIACTAMAFGMTVVDGFGAIGDDALMLTHIGEGSFDTHPNDLGYELLAKAHRLASR